MFVHVEFEIEDHRRWSIDIGDHDYGVLHSASLPTLVCDPGKRVRSVTCGSSATGDVFAFQPLETE